MLIVKICLVFFLPLLALALAQVVDLELVTTNTKLPSPRTEVPTHYDGDDSIYLLGGQTSVEMWDYDILKYSISNQTIQTIGRMGAKSGDANSIGIGANEFILFGGRDRNSITSWISKFNLADNWTVVNDLPEPSYGGEAVWDGSENAYVFGGITTRAQPYLGLDTITQYSIVKNQVEIVARFPHPRYGGSAIWDNRTSVAYLFGGIMPEFNYMDQIFSFDPATRNVSELSVFLPVGAIGTCGIWTGKEAYVIGGYNNKVERYVPIVAFNPDHNSIKIVPINNFPDLLYGTGCVYVDKLKRIYLFGGRSGSIAKFMDEIMYVDLEKPFVPGPCYGMQDGTLVPNPFCCESYYECQNQQTILHQCLPDLQFNPATKSCQVQELVECGIAYGKK